MVYNRYKTNKIQKNKLNKVKLEEIYIFINKFQNKVKIILKI